MLCVCVLLWMCVSRLGCHVVCVCVLLWMAKLWRVVSWVSGLGVSCCVFVCVLLWMARLWRVVSWVSGLGVFLLCVCVLLGVAEI